MREYKIHKFYVCRETGAVKIERSFAQTENLVVGWLDFSTLENAEIFIEREKRDWFNFCIDKWVNHKKMIIDAQEGNTQAKDSLKLCMDALQVYPIKGITTIAKSFLNGLKHFEAIIPSSNNPSYQSSCENLKQLISFCKTELNQI